MAAILTQREPETSKTIDWLSDSFIYQSGRYAEKQCLSSWDPVIVDRPIKKCVIAWCVVILVLWAQHGTYWGIIKKAHIVQITFWNLLFWNILSFISNCIFYEHINTGNNRSELKFSFTNMD